MRGKLRPPAVLLVPSFIVIVACGDDGSARGDGGARDAALSDGETRSDGGSDADGGARTDASTGDDASTGADGGTGPCDCDVTSLCDDACSCDVACTAVPGEPPVGDDTVLMNRAEVAVYFSSTSAGAADRVTVRDDAWDPDPGSTLATTVTPPASPYAALSAPAMRPPLGSVRSAVAADADGDGKDEVVLATATSLIVEDWSGTALVPRTIASWTAADRVDVATGDVDGDGSRDVAVLTIRGGTATVAVHSVPETGAGTVIASATRPNVDRGAIGVGDTNGDGVAELVLVYAETPSLTPSYRRISWASYLHDGTAVLAPGMPVATSAACEGVAADIADEGGDALVADLDNDGTDEIAFAFTCVDSDTELYVYDPNPTGVGNLKGPYRAPGVGDELRAALALRPTLALARVRGSGEAPGSVLPGRFVMTWTSSVTVLGPEEPTATVGIFEYREDLFTQPVRSRNVETLGLGPDILANVTAATADVDLDGDDEIVIAADTMFADDSGCGPFPPCTGYLRHDGVAVWAIDPVGFSLSPTTVLTQDYGFATTMGTGPGPVALLGDFDGDGLRVRATGEVLLRQSPPHVNAVLAAPPTWLGAGGVVQAGDSGTSFGTADTSSTARSQQIGASASVTLSAEGSFLNVAEVRASATYSVGFSTTMTTERSISVGTETTTGPESDLVIYRTTPYASHVYEVLAHPDSAVVGQQITIDVPGTLVETARDLVGFRAAFGTLADGVVPPALLGHTLGDPRSYLAPSECTEAALDAALAGVGDASDVFATASGEVGSSPSGSTSRFVTFGEQTSRSTELSLGVELSAGVSVGGVGLDVTASLTSAWTHETTVGSEVTYTGAVSHIGAGLTAATTYNWGLCVFHFESADGRASYPVVTYVVDGF